MSKYHETTQRGPLMASSLTNGERQMLVALADAPVVYLVDLGKRVGRSWRGARTILNKLQMRRLVQFTHKGWQTTTEGRALIAVREGR